LPTVVKISCRQTVNSSHGREHIIDNETTSTTETTPLSEQQTTDIDAQESSYEKLKTEHAELKRKYDELSSKYEQCVLRIEHVLASDTNFKFYTVFQNYATFKVFLDFLQPACNFLTYAGSSSNVEYSAESKKLGRKRSMSPEQGLFMVLVCLRCGLMGVDIAHRFGISEAHVSRIWATWLEFLYHQLRALPIWASCDYIQQTMPQPFKQTYPNTRVIIDCTELLIEMPTSFGSQSATFSSYKNHNTAKGLLGISPAGYPTFVSELYAGRAYDKQVTKDCGILTLLESGDDIMADRGFDIADDMPAGVGLNIPPFLNGASQLSLTAENDTRNIAALRVHVERAIQRIKSSGIIKNVFPLKMSSDLNKIWVICSYLTLFYPPLINDKCESE
jgi:hypothetical protein